MRAKDLHMAAVVDPVERTVYLTGAIDVNETRINMEIDLPAVGDWRLIKAETNLTDAAWTSWLITLGEGMRLRTGPGARLFSRQFSRTVHSNSGRSFLFFDGTVRPGEPVVKVMDIHTDTPFIMASHSRTCCEFSSAPVSEEAAKRYLEEELQSAARKPIVDVRAAVTVLDTRAHKLVEPA